MHPNSGLRTNPLLSCYCATYRAHRKGPYDESSPTIFIYQTLDIQESTPGSGAELWSFVGNSILTVPGHMVCPSTHLKNLNNFFGLFCSEPAFFFFAHVMYESSDHGSRHAVGLDDLNAAYSAFLIYHSYLPCPPPLPSLSLSLSSSPSLACFLPLVLTGDRPGETGPKTRRNRQRWPSRTKGNKKPCEREQKRFACPLGCVEQQREPHGPRSRGTTALAL